jgi:hypothetical protein
MGVMPFKQTVTVKRKGEVDRWGNATTTVPPFTLNCRFEEKAKLMRHTSNQAGASQVLSEEVVSQAQIYFDKFTDIRSTDEIEYTDEYGNKHTYSPLSIERIRGINGKAVLTVVSV